MWVWISELVCTVVIAFVLWRYAVPPVRKAMRRQQDTIREQLEESEKAQQRLDEASQAYEKAVAEARTDAAKIRDDARADAQRIEEEMQAYAEREIERIRQRGEEQLVLQRQQLTRELRAHIGNQAAELAGRIVHEHLGQAGNREATVDRALDELEGMAAPAEGDTATAGVSKGGA